MNRLGSPSQIDHEIAGMAIGRVRLVPFSGTSIQLGRLQGVLVQSARRAANRYRVSVVPNGVEIERQA